MDQKEPFAQEEYADDRLNAFENFDSSPPRNFLYNESPHEVHSDFFHDTFLKEKKDKENREGYGPKKKEKSKEKFFSFAKKDKAFPPPTAIRSGKTEKSPSPREKLNDTSKNGLDRVLKDSQKIDSQNPPEKFPKVLELNVGGHFFSTSIETLTRYPQSMLGVMFSGRHTTTKDKDEKYFIDRDGPAFGVILNFLRTDRVFFGLVDPELVYNEAEYYRIPLIASWEEIADTQELRDRLELEGEKNIVALLRKSTLAPWYSYAQQTITTNMPKLVDVLSRGSQKHGSFGASLALYQNEKKKKYVVDVLEDGRTRIRCRLVRFNSIFGKSRPTPC